MTRQRSDYEKKRCRENMNYRLAHNYRRTVQRALQNGQGRRTAEELLGCTLEEYRTYLTGKFSAGMFWSNYGLWHIDHIIPCCSFDLSDIKEVKECFRYTNTQPMWKEMNLMKGRKADGMLPSGLQKQ